MGTIFERKIVYPAYGNSKIAYGQIKAILCLSWGLFMALTNEVYMRFLSQRKRRRDNQNEEFHTAILSGLLA